MSDVVNEVREESVTKAKEIYRDPALGDEGEVAKDLIMSDVVNKDPALGDILKSEADPNSRVAFAVESNVAIGDLVEYQPEGVEEPIYLVALSDNPYGKVLLQPRNCTINLSAIDQTAIDVHKAAGLSLEKLKAQGFAHGIHYIGTPKQGI